MNKVLAPYTGGVYDVEKFCGVIHIFPQPTLADMVRKI